MKEKFKQNLTVKTKMQDLWLMWKVQLSEIDILVIR